MPVAHSVQYLTLAHSVPVAHSGQYPTLAHSVPVAYSGQYLTLAHSVPVVHSGQYLTLAHSSLGVFAMIWSFDLSIVQDGFLESVMGDGIVHDGVVAQDDTQMSTLWQLREGVGPACGQVSSARNVAIALFD